MTREEAIEFGKMWLELQEDCKDSNTYEFFKMAIEALQQEPTYISEVAQKAYAKGRRDENERWNTSMDRLIDNIERKKVR